MLRDRRAYNLTEYAYEYYRELQHKRFSRERAWLIQYYYRQMEALAYAERDRGAA